jgi:dephospho-CoA kinase
MKNETIVVTGSIGSGKSRVLETIKNFSQVKVDFFSFDEFTRELYLREDVRDFLMVMFGTTDRSKISDMVFAAGRQMGKTETVSILREQLNDFFFKLVEEKFIELVNRKQNSTLVIEMPLFFEMKERSSAIQMVRSKVKVIAVVCDEAVRMQRVKLRDGFSEDKIKSIVSSQIPQEVKVEKADYVIDTTDGHCDVHVQDLMKVKFKKVFQHVDPK